MKVTKGTARHAHIHFAGIVATASVNVEYTHTAEAGALPDAKDIDVDVPKGSALERSIAETGKLLAAAAAKKLGVPVAVVVAPKADKADKVPVAPKKKAAK